MNRMFKNEKLFFTPFTRRHRHLLLGQKKVLHQGRRLCARTITDHGNIKAKEYGVFGLKDLKNAKDFDTMSQKAIHRCNQIRTILLSSLEKVERGTVTPSADILLLLDSISNEVCSVIDAAELCRNVHEDNEFRLSAERAFSQLSAYIHELNTDATLYRSLMTIVDNKEVWLSLTEEQRRVAEDLKKEFEADGIHKQDSERAVVISQLQRQLVETESKFMQNISSGEDAPFKVGPFEDQSYGQQIKHWLAQVSPQDQYAPLVTIPSDKNEDKSQAQEEGLYAVCSARRGITRGIVTSVADSRVRQQAWRGGLLHPRANTRVLGNLVKTRQMLARELGYESWAEKVLLGSAAGNPQDVWSFLINAAENIRESSEQILKELSILQSNSNVHSRGFYPWDAPYYAHLHTTLQAQRRKVRLDANNQSSWKSEKHTGHGAGADASQQATEYFSLSVAMEALHDLTQRLFGIRMTVTPLKPEETWGNYANSTGFSSGSISNSGSVAEIMHSIGSRPFKLVVQAADGSPMGEVLIDLYQRPNKFTGAAHFTVRCGCSVLGETHYEHVHDLSRSLKAGKSREQKDLLHLSSRQLPLVALVFNYPPPASGLFASFNAPAEPQLSLSDLNTLFHEWGHALHSLLSHTTYQHLSGTRGTLDFVEVPSHLFEYFASDPSLLQSWGRHYATGKGAPDGLFTEALEQRRSMEIMEVQGQLLYALCDQYAFGTGIGDVSTVDEEEVFRRVMDGAATLQRQHIPSVLLAPSTHTTIGLPDLHLPNHSHFVTYGGSYYSYLYAKMYAAQIWNLRFKKDPLNEASGRALFEGLLKFGVSRPPKEILEGICQGQELDPKYYFREITQSE